MHEAPATAQTYAEEALRRCDALAACSEEPGRITRRFATPALAQANALVTEWMRAAGMAVRHDAIGNLIGRYEAAAPGAPALLLGSHLDSVRDAGRYDGPLGVLAALACVARLHAAGARLPFALELYAFADEEGVRYHTTYLGSRAAAGTFDTASLARAHADGVAMADAIRAAGGDPAALPDASRAADAIIGYVELHIEQGPVLEALDLPVGVVTAIAGQSRVALEFRGLAGHAGTVPMALRRDALCAAAEFVLAAEAQAHATDGLVATVGQVGVEPGASNVIPGAAALSLDVRHHDDAVRTAAAQALQARATAIGARRGVAAHWQPVQSSDAVRCDARLAELLGQAIAAQGYPAHALPSGAGHDAVAMAAIAPVAMLFVRCQGGISHHPAESVAAADVAVGIETLSRFLGLLAATGQGQR